MSSAKPVSGGPEIEMAFPSGFKILSDFSSVFVS